FERREAASLSARIEPEALLGINQIYGGVQGDGSLAPQAACVLPGGRTLELELAARLDEPGLYPLTFELFVEGSRRGTLTLARADDRQVVALALAPEEGTRPIELALQASDWGLAEVGGLPVLVAARFVRAETRP
ncbi:MAG: hypothetical protein ABL998_17720, partial [Planctomycetota bacterium]